MKAIVIERFGAPDGLALVDRPVPIPGAGQLHVKVEAAGVGGVDVLVRSGALAEWGFTPGHIPGSELAGVVTGVGDAVDPGWLGRRVWGFTGAGGGYVEEAALDVDQVVELPAGVTSAAAVTLAGSGLVAHFGLRHGHLRAGERVLIRGASGGIGVMAVQEAARADAGGVAVTTSSPERGELLRALGATEVLDRSMSSGEDAGAEYDVIFDIVGGPEVSSLFERLAPSGRLVSVGAVNGFPPADFAAPLIALFQRSLSYATFSTNTVPEPDRLVAVAEIFRAAAAGELRAVIAAELPLADAAEAHRRLEAGGVFGRIALTPD